MEVGLSMWYKARVRSVVAGLEYFVAVHLCIGRKKRIVPLTN